MDVTVVLQRAGVFEDLAALVAAVAAEAVGSETKVLAVWKRNDILKTELIQSIY